MYQVGDKIVYPMHGAGVIESIEEKEVLGEKKKYYILKIPVAGMKVMIPVEKVSSLGIREVTDQSQFSALISVLKEKDENSSVNWNKRYRLNMDKIKTGNIFEVADVVKNLMRREKDKGLSTGEKKMLESARKILISELILMKGINSDQATQFLEDVINS